MIKRAFSPKSATQVVDHYIETRRRADLPISTGQAVVAIRTVMPNCGLSDRELVNLIAASAIRQGRNVAFETIEKSIPENRA
ncbi:hypothetical protein ABFT80_11170 [Mesorhizobium sp. SB112]|uniref:hypothetical protein n=1 Tax=Mesorhizobium sp. SB112 TaxID=3151853 RepID=UPI003265F7FD